MLLKMIDQFVTQLPLQAKVCVALSGGLDSTVLLHLLSQTAALKNRLSACYVHHGLAADATQWQAHCKQMCAALNVPFKAVKIAMVARPKEGIEAAARTLRYQALVNNLTSDQEVLVTAHHQRDQAETILLNLLRGSGVKGLAGMAMQRTLQVGERRVLVHRPLLNAPFETLQDYAQQQGLSWVEDPSNQSQVFRRNFVRHAVLPVLKQKWPSVERTLARNAQNVQESVQLLDRLAKIDLDQAWSNRYFIDFEWFAKNSLLDWTAQKNALRFWFWHHHGLILLAEHYAWIEGVVKAQGQSENSAFSYLLVAGELRFYQQRLYYLSATHWRNPMLKVNLAQALQSLGRTMVWHEGFLETLPHGSYAFGVVKSALLFNERPLTEALHSLTLVSLARVRAQPVLAGQLNTHRLKRFFQTQKIPTWERTFWPVLIIDQQVLAVLGCNGAVKTDALAAKPHANDWLTLTLNQDERLQWPSLDGVFVDE